MSSNVYLPSLGLACMALGTVIIVSFFLCFKEDCYSLSLAEPVELLRRICFPFPFILEKSTEACWNLLKDLFIANYKIWPSFVYSIINTERVFVVWTVLLWLFTLPPCQTLHFALEYPSLSNIVCGMGFLNSFWCLNLKCCSLLYFVCLQCLFISL